MATAARSEYAWRVGDRSRALKLFERAYQCQLAGDLAGAVHLYQASLAELPSAEAHTFLGWVYSFERRYDEAIAECKKAIAVDPTFGNPYNDIGAYLLVLAPLDPVCADVVVRISKRRIHGDRLLTLGNGLVQLALEMIRPAQEGMGFGGGVQLDGAFIELDCELEVALHLQLVGVLEQLPGHLESRVRHVD